MIGTARRAAGGAVAGGTRRRCLLAVARTARAVSAAWALSFAGPASADQHAPALDGLFDELAAADTPVEAQRLEGRIWQAWLEAPDADSARLLDDVQSAMAGGDGERALELADRLVELAPDFAEAWNKRATILFIEGDPDASVADIRETLALEPRHFGAISGLGQIFLRRGEPAAALKAFREVLRLSPASESARRGVEIAEAALESKEI